VIDSPGGLGVQAGQAITYLFDTQAAQQVGRLSFQVRGSTQALEVVETQDTGTVPGPSCALGIAATSYDRSCTQDADCVAVFSGDVCNSDCRCPNAAIRASALTRYEADATKLVKGPSICNCSFIPAPRCVQAGTGALSARVVARGC
jgi:hypothetical protein